MELDMNMTGPVQLLPTLPASSTRQLVRRRTGHAAESPSIQRCRSTITAHAPATQAASTGKRSRLSPPSSGNIAVVRPGSNDNRVRQDRKNPRESSVRPPRQVLSARVLAHSNPYMVKQPPKERRSGTQRARNQQHPTVATSRSDLGGPPAPRRAAPLPPASQMRPSLRSVRAKVDSHLCPHLSNRQRSAPKQPQPAQPSSQRTCQSTKGKSLAAAHQQLELMLTRIERVTDYQPPPPPPAAQFKRRGSGVKVAKGVSRQMAHPPPVPAGTPMLSARKNKNSAMRTDGGGGAEWEEDRNGNGEGDGDGEGDHIDNAIPLVQNPQCLPPAKRDALMKLLQRTEQHDKGIVDMMGTTGDSRDAMLMLLQMMPLSLEDSPYKKKLVDGHRHPKERQKQQQKLRPVDEDFKELKELHGPDGQERYHNVRNALEHRSDPHPLSERQEQAMLEREQLERDKQLVINCREKRRLKEQIGEQPPPQDSNQSKNPTKESNKSTDPWKQVLQDRDRFQANCNRSCFYNNSQSSAVWKIYAKVASKLSSQLIASVDVEFHRSVINYINDIVGHKVK